MVVQDRRDNERACSSAACERGSSPTLPDLHLEVRARDHLDELGVDLLRERSIAFEQRPHLRTASGEAAGRRYVVRQHNSLAVEYIQLV